MTGQSGGAIHEDAPRKRYFEELPHYFGQQNSAIKRMAFLGLFFVRRSLAAFVIDCACGSLSVPATTPLALEAVGDAYVGIVSGRSLRASMHAPSQSMTKRPGC
jgi:hypothetical protein